MDEQEQILKDAFLSLPKVMQDTITDSDVQSKLHQLSKKYNLHIDKWKILENEIMMALLGISEPEDLAKNINTEADVSMDMALQIANDVGKIVFNPIQQKLKNNIQPQENIIEKSKKPIDISKFLGGASADPSSYTPKAYTNTDPYQEPVE
jgi:hypothetical protein